MNRIKLLGTGMVIALVMLTSGCGSLPRNRGYDTLFRDNDAFHFEALRTVGYTATGGADVNEVLVTLDEIRTGDKESWYLAWRALAERTEAAAGTYTVDTRGRGVALLKASNYYRTAEFFFPGEHELKTEMYERTRATFYEGLSTLGIEYELSEPPYGETALESLYFRSDDRENGSTLILFLCGYDSIKEEGYFSLGAEALRRGYSFLAYDGPGQGSTIRWKGVPMTHEWGAVNRAVLDHFLATHPEITTIVAVGNSLGSVLATKAAAADDRIDYLVHFDVFYDFAQAVGQPDRIAEVFFDPEGPSARAARWLRWGMRFSSTVDWAMRHGAWVMGTGEDYAEAFNRYRFFEIREDAPRVSIPVLLLAGGTDHFVPIEMAEESQAAFTGTDDVTLIVYSEESGGGEHCQVGATYLWTADLFEWLAAREGSGRKVSTR